MKSTLLNMVAVLFGITLIASAGVGAVNMVTLEPIERAKAEAINDAVLAVLPPFENKTVETLTLDNMDINVYTTTDADGATVGYAVETMTKQGFNGVVKLMVGFLPTGEINNINVVEQAETPGLGTQMCDEGNPLIGSFKGRNPGLMTLAVKKDGGDVDALTAATISSRAYTDAVKRAWEAFNQITNANDGGEFAEEGGCDE